MRGEVRESGGRLRAAVVVGLFVVALGLAWVLTRDDEYTVTAQFENAAALVPGNQVVIGLRPVGTVDEIRLAPDGQANVTITVDEEYAPLRRGTVATVRWASLSSVANRQVQLTPPAEGMGEEIPDGG